jgi:hexokinase
VGFIHGTGVNAAYPEKVSSILKLHDSHLYAKGTTMLVNTEIDIFGSEAYLPLNKYDKELDASHSQPNFQLYEKMMSGAYIGELVRLASLDLISQNELFNGNKPKEFDVAFEFGTSITSNMERYTFFFLKVKKCNLLSSYTV